MGRRFYVALTAGELAALQEALSERRAGEDPRASGGLPMVRYDAANEALVQGSWSDVAPLFMSAAEAFDLLGYIGGARRTAATTRAIKKLQGIV